jgi:hypothetical protein
MFRSQWITPRVTLTLIVALVGVSAVVARKASAIGLRRASSAQNPRPAPFTPTDQYETRQIEGWTVLVNKQLLRDSPELAEQALTLLGHQLYQVVRKVPAASVEKLRAIRFWVEESTPPPPCMTYHPHPKWLREHGKNPEKAGGIEITSVRNYLAFSLKQPWMALHELSHAYHHRFLKGGFDNPDVKAAYRDAMRSKLYDSVLQIDGRREKAYAATNHQEFFAEQSESYFGTNDFYPFVSPELKQHDPATFALLQRVWGKR